KLTHSWREGKSSEGEFLEDYAYYLRGLLDLFQVDPSHEGDAWLQGAIFLADNSLSLFLSDEKHFYLRPDGQTDLVIRPRDEFDGAIPAPGSIMIGNLFRLHRITEKTAYAEAGEAAMAAISGMLRNRPTGMTAAILALDYYQNDKIEVIVVGEGPARDAMLKTIYSHYLPNALIALSKDGQTDSPLFENRAVAPGVVRAYVCRNSVCNLPAETNAELAEQLDKL
ncbi:MAG: hypothetical protein V3T31_10305, partial [candidate division Zixibacteria bacterium]